MNARSISVFIFCLLIYSLLIGQTQEIELNPDGVIVPRVDHTTVASPQAGQLVFDINTNSFWFHNGSSWSELGSIFEKSANTVRQSAGYYTDHFLFGSPQLENDGDVNHNSRLFFNKQKRAFRAGSTRDTTFFNLQLSGSNTIWDDSKLGYYSFASGLGNEASGESSFAMGEVSTASGRYSLAMGWGSEATGRASTSIGFQTDANGFASTALGRGTIANGETSTVIGRWSADVDMVQSGVDDTTRLFIIGNGNSAADRSNAIVVQKNGRVGIGENSPDALLHINGEGTGLHVDPDLPVVFGADTTGSGIKAFWLPSKAAFRAGGVGDGSLGGFIYSSDEKNWDPDSIGVFSFATGLASKAKGDYSTAMGLRTQANGDRSTAMGVSTHAIGGFSTAMGVETQANGFASTSMGWFTRANGIYSASLGQSTQANGDGSTAMGWQTQANGYYSTVIGLFNDTVDVIQTLISDTTRLFIIGNGSSDIDRSNAMVVQKNGRVGIGTNRPAAQLEVAGHIFLGRGETTSNLTRSLTISGSRNSSGSDFAKIDFENLDNNTPPTDQPYIGARISSQNDSSDDDGDLRFYTTTDQVLSQRMRISSSGNIGIGVSIATAQLHTTGSVRFANFGAGTLTTDANGNLSVSSDIRLKEVKGGFDRGLEAISQLSPIRYNWKSTSNLDTTTSYAGFSAQNVQEAIPEAVGTSSDGYLTLSDRPIIATLVNAVNQQQKMIEQQQLIIETQSHDISELKQLVSSMLPSGSKDLGQIKSN